MLSRTSTTLTVVVVVLLQRRDAMVWETNSLPDLNRHLADDDRDGLDMSLGNGNNPLVYNVGCAKKTHVNVAAPPSSLTADDADSAFAFQRSPESNGIVN